MLKITNFFKKHWLLVMIGSILVLMAVSALLPKTAIYTPPPTPTPVDKIADFNSIVPGRSTEEDLRTVLGTPSKTVFENGRIIDEFEASYGLRTHMALLENNQLKFFKEIVTSKDKKTVTDIKNVYGNPPHVVFDPNPNATFNLYVYPNNGIAYLGHEDGGLREVWYFEPITLDDFMKTWGSEYQLKRPTVPQQ